MHRKEEQLSRCPKRRKCRRLDGSRVFKPAAIPLSELQTVPLGLDELEAMRLCDVEGLDQSRAGMQMAISRGTVQRLLARGRKKLVEALISNQAVVVEPRAAGALHSCADTADIGSPSVGDYESHIHKEQR
jgi:predicted DNA-binding protein (UPF0251 family)